MTQPPPSPTDAELDALLRAGAAAPTAAGDAERCPAPGRLAAFQADALDAAEASAIASHLVECVACRDLLASPVRPEAVARALAGVGRAAPARSRGRTAAVTAGAALAAAGLAAAILLVRPPAPGRTATPYALARVEGALVTARGPDAQPSAGPYETRSFSTLRLVLRRAEGLSPEAARLSLYVQAPGGALRRVDGARIWTQDEAAIVEAKATLLFGRTSGRHIVIVAQDAAERPIEASRIAEALQTGAALEGLSSLRIEVEHLSDAAGPPDAGGGHP